MISTEYLGRGLDALVDAQKRWYNGRWVYGAYRRKSGETFPDKRNSHWVELRLESPSTLEEQRAVHDQNVAVPLVKAVVAAQTGEQVSDVWYDP